jgi:hypothetical protein
MSLLHPFKLRNSVVLISALIAVLLLSGCGITAQFDSSVDKAVLTLEKAIRDLGNANADWQEILNDALEEIPDELQSTIGFEVNRTLQNAISASGSEVKCIVDFLRDRVREDLIRIKASLLNQEVPPLMPVFCAVESVDYAKVKGAEKEQRQNNLLIYGYNFDSKNPVEIVLLERTQGQGLLDDIIDDVPDLDLAPERRLQLPERLREVDVDENLYLAVKNHYEMELNLGSHGVPLSENSQFFSFRWEGSEMSRTPIIHPFLPLCETKEVSAQPQVVTYVPPFIEGSGNRDFNGDGPHVSVEVELFPTNLTQFDITISMSARQTSNEVIASGGFPVTYTVAPGTAAGGYEVYENVISVPSGYVIQEVLTPLRNGIEYTDDDHASDNYAPMGFGPASHFEIDGDTDGDEAGTDTKVTVTFNRIEYRIVQVSNCR